MARDALSIPARSERRGPHGQAGQLTGCLADAKLPRDKATWGPHLSEMCGLY